MLKVITIYNQETESMEEVILEELQVFKVNCALNETYIQLTVLDVFQIKMSKKNLRIDKYIIIVHKKISDYLDII